METIANFAAQAYSASRPATEPDKAGGSQSQLAEAAQNFASVLQTGEQTAISSMTGDADPHALVQALAQTELAVETAVTIRDKMVEAYQEILRMPV